MNRSTIKYLLALLLFGSNGIVASRISMNSYEIVMFRTLIGSLLLIILYLATNHRFTFYKHKKSFAFLALTGIACALMSAVMYACMVSFNKKADQIVGMENATLQLTIAFLSASVYVLIRQGWAFSIQTSDVAPLLVLGLVNTRIGCFLYFSSIGDIPVQSERN